ncbi:FAD-binding oxidoreductase [Alisedimentitalea sp. MJ-SS2]|uniref:FAD-binding oxidoreductase n=1 Tax=Aliisedimentitalea sp. MJ-SS2 TaxID=3049795 RepID=UPI0029067676|nr:FAD-binding oxidoreductase [Alisedimentitalea sp. MJ-SS2]MDU8926106.1 FAD-binding oxidoreductase [Alisedimentitalea sp. MJ-SS2]
MTLNPVDTTFIEILRAALPDAALRPVEPRYLEEPRGKWHGQAGIVVAPTNVQDVATAIRAANAARVPVLPYGGGTGLVGAQVMPNGPTPMILSLERMNAIRAVYPEENVLVAEAGAILQDIHEAAEAHNRLFPLTIAAKGSARIGGNLSTNAGGVNVLRYGNARDLCLGIEAVLPDGSTYHGLTRLRKDNTGYDLRNLLIGAEGTLGVITAAALKLSPTPGDSGTALLIVDSPRAALDLLAMARDQVGEAVSAFELIDGTGFNFLAEKLPDIRRPFDPAPQWMALIELGLSGGLRAQDALERLFETGLEAGLVSDGIVAQSEAQRDNLWEIREQIPEANRLVGSISSHDVSLPLSEISHFIIRAGQELARLGDFRINCFGHLGDGNLHYNVFPLPGKTRADFPGLGPRVQELVHDIVVEMGGSFSAEHGVGRLKSSDLERYGDPARLAAMRAIKMALDPQGIMNPGAVLRQE